MLRKLSAFLKRLRGEDPYNEIRRKLCKAFEPSMEQKLDALLATSSMGDERPMEFGLELQQLLGEATTDDILKRIFLRSAPPSIVTVIKPYRKAKFEELLEAAEDVWATEAAPSGSSTATVAAISAPSTAQRWGSRGGRQRGARMSGQPTSTLAEIVNCAKTDIAYKQIVHAFSTMPRIEQSSRGSPSSTIKASMATNFSLLRRSPHCGRGQIVLATRS